MKIITFNLIIGIFMLMIYDKGTIAFLTKN